MINYCIILYVMLLYLRVLSNYRHLDNTKLCLLSQISTLHSHVQKGNLCLNYIFSTGQLPENWHKWHCAKNLFISYYWERSLLKSRIYSLHTQNAYFRSIKSPNRFLRCLWKECFTRKINCLLSEGVLKNPANDVEINVTRPLLVAL